MLRKYLHDQIGATTVEYALTALLFVVAVIAALNAVAGS